MYFKHVSMFNMFFISDLFWDGNSTLHSYSDSVFRHAYNFSRCLYGFLYLD